MISYRMISHDIRHTSRPEFAHGTIVYTYDTLRCAASASGVRAHARIRQQRHERKRYEARDAAALAAVRRPIWRLRSKPPPSKLLRSEQ